MFCNRIGRVHVSYCFQLLVIYVYVCMFSLQDGLFLVTAEPEVVTGYTKTILTPNAVEFERLYEKMVIIYYFVNLHASYAYTLV